MAENSDFDLKGAAVSSVITGLLAGTSDSVLLNVAGQGALDLNVQRLAQAEAERQRSRA